MKNPKEVKRVFDEIKRQAQDVQYYIDHISIPAGHDRESSQSRENLNRAKITLNYLHDNIRRNLSDFNRELDNDISDEVDRKYTRHLTSVNSPNSAMVKNSETNMTIKKSIMDIAIKRASNHEKEKS